LPVHLILLNITSDNNNPYINYRTSQLYGVDSPRPPINPSNSCAFVCPNRPSRCMLYVFSIHIRIYHSPMVYIYARKCPIIFLLC
jgi:hypothetical protein